MTTSTNMVHCQLWMGGLEPYMTESFILSSFQRMGEKPMNVKVMRNKYTGEPAGYCFVHFENDDEAIDAMHKLNGKIIPGTNPAVRFRLNTASNQGKIMMNEREFSLWVGDLSSEVDDYTLFKCFAAKYQSIKAAKVILDAAGYSKGFGFLRFGLEEEQKHCLNHMNGYKGLGSKPLKISNAIPKSQRPGPPNGPQMNQQGGGYQYPPDYSQYYDPNYWQNYGQWGGYGYDPSSGSYGTGYDPSSGTYTQYGASGQYPAQYGGQYPGQYGAYPPPTGGYPQPPYPGYYPPQTPATGPPPPTAPVTSAPPPTAATTAIAPVDDANEVVEHSTPVDVEKENREYADAILNFWVDLASNTGTSKELFEEEMSKLNVIEVTNPSVTIKFETRLAAKRAVEAQGHEGFLTSASSDSSDCEEPDAKKRRLSTDTKSEDETGKEDAVKKEDTVKEDDVKKEDAAKEEGGAEVKIKTEAEDSVAIKEEITEGGGGPAEPINADDVDSKFDVKTDTAEDEKAKEKMRAECSKVIGFMASVDVDVMMNEMERVSSDSSSDSSDSEGEDAAKKSSKDKKCKSKEKPTDSMETGDPKETVAGIEKEEDAEQKKSEDAMECDDVPKKDDFVASEGGEQVATSMAKASVKVFKRENMCYGDLDEMSQPSDEEVNERVNTKSLAEEPGNGELDENSPPAAEEPSYPESASKNDQPEPAQKPAEEFTTQECFEDNPDAEPLEILPSSVILDDETSLDQLVKADPTSDGQYPTSDVTLDTLLLNGRDTIDQNLSSSPEGDLNSKSSEESSD